jgi:hypothetical protein
MTFSGFDNMTFIGKNLLPLQKIYRTCDLVTTPADRLKIEIPINIEIPNNETGAPYNKDNTVNKLVTVFASELTEEPF